MRSIDLTYISVPALGSAKLKAPSDIFLKFSGSRGATRIEHITRETAAELVTALQEALSPEAALMVTIESSTLPADDLPLRRLDKDANWNPNPRSAARFATGADARAFMKQHGIADGVVVGEDE